MNFSANVRIRGKYKFEVAERGICRGVARAALSPQEKIAYQEGYGEEFDGSGTARQRLPESLSQKVDEAILRSMREAPELWETSPSVVVAPQAEWADNLVVDRGLDRLGAHAISFATFTNYCVLGTGTTPVAVTDTALTTEIVRTANKLSSVTTDDNPTRTRTITNVFDFPAEASNRNYAELGLSDTATAGSNLTTHALISGGTVTVLIGQQARVSYAILSTVAANYTSTPTVTGDSASFGSSAGEMVFCTLGMLSASVVTDVPNTQLLLGTGSTKPAFGTAFTPGTQSPLGTTAFSSYVTGSFSSVRTGKWDLATGNRTDWRSISPSAFADPAIGSFAFVFDAAKTKDSLHTLTVTWAINYSR